MSIIDIAVVLLSLIFIIWWAVRHGKSGDSGSYFLAGRTMPWWGIGLSLFAASISSTTLIGQTGDAYSTGLAVFNYNLVGVVVMVFFAVFLLPVEFLLRAMPLPPMLLLLLPRLLVKAPLLRAVAPLPVLFPLPVIFLLPVTVIVPYRQCHQKRPLPTRTSSPRLSCSACAPWTACP